MVNFNDVTKEKIVQISSNSWNWPQIPNHP